MDRRTVRHNTHYCRRGRVYFSVSNDRHKQLTDTAIAVITRAGGSGPTYLFRPKGLHAMQRYTVWFEIDGATYSQTGAQLMSNGIRVALPKPYSSDVMHIEPQ